MEDKTSEESRNNLAYLLEKIRGNAHVLVRKLEGKTSADEEQDKPREMLDMLETEVMRLKVDIKMTMGGSEKQRFYKKMQLLKKKAREFMEMKGMDIYKLDDHEDIKSRIEEVKMYLDEKLKVEMEELKKRFESIKWSINLLTSKQDMFCKDEADMADYDDVEPGLDFFIAISALLNSPYVNKEKICR